MSENKGMSESNETPDLAEMDGSQSAQAKIHSKENLPSNCTDEQLHQNTQDISEGNICTSHSSHVQSPISQEHHDEGLQPSESLVDAQDQSIKTDIESLKGENASVPHSEEPPNKRNDESQDSLKKNSLLKMLASAYMSRKQPAQLQCEQSMRTRPLRKVSARATILSQTVKSSSNSGYFINHLRQKVAKYGLSRDTFRQPYNILNVKHSKKKKKKRIMSTTKTLYPVVALETCQKLVRDNIEGKHQCGVCRRVFQDVDSLIMHHVLHKKERVKFCRRCRQYLMCVISVPNNHICSSFNTGLAKHFSLPLSNSPGTQHPPKLFRCTFCNRSYTRRHTLKKHNCQWIASLKQSVSEAQDDLSIDIGEGSSAEKQLDQVNVGVNTVGLQQVKNEELSADSSVEEICQMSKNTPFNSGVRLVSAKSFPPFCPNVSKLRSLPGQGKETDDSLSERKWTVPLDDAEIDIIDEEKPVVEAQMKNTDDVVVLEPIVKCQTSSALSSKDFQVYISASGVKRFSCNRCQKSYSRRFTVKQHLKICGARKLFEHHSHGMPNILAKKKRFPCSICGTAFTRKDNMNMHRKRCISLRNMNCLEGNKMSEKKNQASRENIFVLPPVSKNDVIQKDSKNSESGSWGIMSLPSVLPRKVTCECGAVFTCPRLLFEHLQMHALESYICSYCGESLPSWAAFETHQNLHSPCGQKSSQPQLQSPLKQVEQLQSSMQNQKKQPQTLLKSQLNHKPLKDPNICPRCKKPFGSRKSMMRHLRLSCRGDMALQKKYSCSRCGMTFQSPLTHKVHVQSNTCMPSFKPIRCPVCVRWFSCVDGLKRHLVSHSKQKVLMCQICGHKCSRNEDLEEHKRTVHDTKEPAGSPTIQSAHVSQSNPSNIFQCQICQRSYPKLQSLKDHFRKVHRTQALNRFDTGASGLQPPVGVVQQVQSKHFQCHICSRIYPDLRSLKNHKRRVHRILGSGLQPSKGIVQQNYSSLFQCNICSRSYPDLTSLRNHRRRVHRILGGLEVFKGIILQSQDNPYKCQICHRSYPDIKSLKNHRRRVHRILGDVPESAKVSVTHVEPSEIKLEPPDITSPPSASSGTAVQ
ncbi:uncharacterized protein im:7147486 [Hoplias malabaricus]|uniref:uncharacterized protein im:7147486 n=1 Tax=Hoplias malabaricus TaxID=27720 RepID=UPI003462EA66